MSDFPILYRRLDSATAVENHMNGKLRFRPIRYFRTIEDEDRKDELEGIGSYKIKDGHSFTDLSDNNPIQGIYILCFSESKENPKWGNFHFEIRAPKKLKERIKAALPPSTVVILAPVDYNKSLEVQNELSDQDWVKRAICSKPARFSDEKEWRYIIMSSHFGDQAIQNPFEVDIGDCSDIFILGSPSRG